MHDLSQKEIYTKTSLFVQHNSIQNAFTDAGSWVILSPIEQSIKRKIEAVGTPLKDWDIQIYRGVLTGYNDAFIISTEKRDEILANCKDEDERSRTAELIRPILRGRDIKRYSYDWANLWLIYLPWHFPLQFDKSITGASEKAEKAFREQYPAVYSHMLLYKESLSRRNKSETGIRYEWYAMQRWGANYWEEFNKPKIVYQELTQGSVFCLDSKGEYYIQNTGYLITGNCLQWLILFLNSSVIEYCFRKFYSITLGENGLRWLAQYMINLPIILPQKVSVFNNLSDMEIDHKIGELYGLSNEEYEFICGVVNE